MGRPKKNNEILNNENQEALVDQVNLENEHKEPADAASIIEDKDAVVEDRNEDQILSDILPDSPLIKEDKELTLKLDASVVNEAIEKALLEFKNLPASERISAAELQSLKDDWGIQLQEQRFEDSEQEGAERVCFVLGAVCQLSEKHRKDYKGEQRVELEIEPASNQGIIHFTNEGSNKEFFVKGKRYKVIFEEVQ